MTLSTAQARRIALAAQGFVDKRHTPPTMRTFQRTLNRTGVLQVDSVNVLQRAHYMPLYSRMGPYDVALLERAQSATATRPRRMVEYWAHVQAFMAVDLWPVMQHRMDDYRAQRGKWSFVESNPALEGSLVAAIRARGASTERDLDAAFGGPARTKVHWGWNWSETRKVLDYLFLVGELAIAGRNSQFEVRYDLPERVLPAEILARPTPVLEDANRELIRRAAISHGVGTAQCLRDYYRMPARGVQGAIDDLVEDGELLPVEIQGWKRLAYLHRDARQPRRISARSLLSPFDPLCWERTRTEQLFDFRYRIEIYVPAPQRMHGYYVLPFLLGDQIVGRVDLKADRSAGRLIVKAAYAERDAPDDTAEQLSAELLELAGWLGLSAISVEPRGDLAPLLRV